MMDAIKIAKQVLLRAFDLLDHYGLGPDAFQDMQAETADLAQILLSAEASDTAKEAARRALQSIPLRIKQNAVAAKADVLQKVELIGGALVRTLLGLADLKFGG